jgi:hypothetical protein
MAPGGDNCSHSPFAGWGSHTQLHPLPIEDTLKLWTRRPERLSKKSDLIPATLTSPPLQAKRTLQLSSSSPVLRPPLPLGKGWRELGSAVSVWTQQARQLAHERLPCRPNVSRAGVDNHRVATETGSAPTEDNGALAGRFALLAQLERVGQSPGLAALHTALEMKPGGAEAAVACLGGTSGMASVLELAGGLALLGLDSRALCGFDECELFRRLASLDRSSSYGPQSKNGGNNGTGRVALKGLISVGSGACSTEDTIGLVKRDGGESQLEANLKGKLFDRWLVLARFVALAAWFGTAPELRRRGRFNADDLTSARAPVDFQERLALSSVRGALGLESGRVAAALPATADSGGLSANVVTATLAAVAPRRLLPHGSTAVRRIAADAQARNQRMSRASSDCDVVRKSILGKETVDIRPHSMLLDAAAQLVDTAVENPRIARQRSHDQLRKQWSPLARDFLASEVTVREEFEAHAATRQLDRRLLGRCDFFRLVGDRPPSDLLADGNGAHESRHVGPTELGAIFDEVLELQASQAALGGSSFTKGLTFESFTLALLIVARDAGLHFSRLVDDAVDTITGGHPSVTRRRVRRLPG